ncbi:MAG: hypothetical protein V1774_05210 [Candidatus Eisenbacteria bacterium]
MKVLYSVLALVFVSLSLGCSQAPHLRGTWELVSPAPPAGGTAESGGTLNTIKVLNDTHFVVVVPRADGRPLVGGGTYRLNGSTYTEMIDFHYVPGLERKSIDFDCRLEGNLWYHAGTVEADGSAIQIKEIWRRVD